MQGRKPLERGGLPRVGGSGCSAAQATDEIDEKDKLGGREQDSAEGDVAIQRERGREQLAGRAESTALAGDPSELGVMARLASKAGEVHGEESEVGEAECEPEMPLAEAFRHEAAGEAKTCGNERKPVIRGGEETKDSGHGHDEVEVGDDEERVVEIFVEDGLSENGAGEASGDEERDEAEGEEHGCGELRAGAPDGCD